MKRRTLPIRKISRSYRLALRYQLDGRPLRPGEIERALRAVGTDRGITGIGIVADRRGR